MEKRAIFITGGYGFLGQHIVKAIHGHEKDAELRVLVRTQRQTHIPIHKLERVRLVQGDLIQCDGFENELDGVETVIHNAALVSFKKGDEEAIFQSNIVGTQNIIKLAVKHGCKNFIFISSISTIGKQPPQPADESMYPDLFDKKDHDYYGYSKLIGERDIQSYASKIRIVILNPSVVIGPGSRRIEELLRWLRFMPVIPVIPFITSFVDVRDVAKAVVLALTGGGNDQRYIVTSENVDMLTFTHTTLRVLEKKAVVFVVPDILIRTADGILTVMDFFRINPGIRKLSALNVDKVYSNQKIRRELGWEPDYTLEKSLADTIY